MSAIVPLKSGGHLSAIYPQSIEEVFRVSRMAVQAGMLKPQRVSGYGDNAKYESEDAVLARGTMIVMQGMEIGVPPMQAIQLLAMINGRITAHSEAVPGLLLAHGCKIKETWTGTEMADDWTCHIELTRPNGDKYFGSFSVKDAKQAGLWDQSPTKEGYQGKIKPNDGSWFRYPKRMLKARALGFVGKDGASDILKGIQIREEAEDIQRTSELRDVTPPSKPVLEIPDDTETKPAPAQTETAAPVEDVEVTDDSPIANPEGFIEHLADALALCDSVEELAEISEGNSDAIKRLPKEFRIKALKMIAEAGE